MPSSTRNCGNVDLQGIKACHIRTWGSAWSSDPWASWQVASSSSNAWDPRGPEGKGKGKDNVKGQGEDKGNPNTQKKRALYEELGHPRVCLVSFSKKMSNKDVPSVPEQLMELATLVIQCWVQ